jgi:hypothetical protein
MSDSHLLRVQLPIGGSLQAFPDVAGQSPECLAVVNLQTQIAPFLTSALPLLKILQLLKPLIKIIELLPNPPVPELMLEFAKAAAVLAPLLTQGAGETVFARDFLCLQIKSLKCFQRNLDVVTEQMSAQPTPSRRVAAQTVLDSYEPIVGLFGLASEIVAASGLSIPSAPTLPPGVDAASLKSDQDAITRFVTALEVATDALGGC